LSLAPLRGGDNPVTTPIKISVIVPTYNRVDCLLRCLAALEKQTLDHSAFEIVVVDDGSTDDTRERLQPLIASGAIRYFHQSNSGPSRARNVGIKAARGELLLFIGDDIIATPQFLAEHLAFHQQSADGDEPFGLSRPAERSRRSLRTKPIAVLGFSDWPDTSDVTPLMKYPGLGQFGYHHIEQGLVNPQDLPYSFFYTSNVSIGRQFLLENDFFFDEDFARAMGEDGELAYRMQKKGLRIIYNPRALAHHEHPASFTDACRRLFLMGQVAILQAKKHPEWGDLSFLKLSWKGKIKHRLNRATVWLISPVLKLADDRRWDIGKLGLHGWYDFVFEVYRFEGLLHGLRVYGVDVDG
jgi:glycosyltransferase involved in cell wall biosynthesis